MLCDLVLKASKPVDNHYTKLVVSRRWEEDQKHSLSYEVMVAKHSSRLAGPWPKSIDGVAALVVDLVPSAGSRTRLLVVHRGDVLYQFDFSAAVSAFPDTVHLFDRMLQTFRWTADPVRRADVAAAFPTQSNPLPLPSWVPSPTT